MVGLGSFGFWCFGVSVFALIEVDRYLFFDGRLVPILGNFFELFPFEPNNSGGHENIFSSFFLWAIRQLGLLISNLSLRLLKETAYGFIFCVAVVVS